MLLDMLLDNINNKISVTVLHISKLIEMNPDVFEYFKFLILATLRRLQPCILILVSFDVTFLLM